MAAGLQQEPQHKEQDNRAQRQLPRLSAPRPPGDRLLLRDGQRLLGAGHPQHKHLVQQRQDLRRTQRGPRRDLPAATGEVDYCLPLRGLQRLLERSLQRGERRRALRTQRLPRLQPVRKRQEVRRRISSPDLTPQSSSMDCQISLLGSPVAAASLVTS